MISPMGMVMGRKRAKVYTLTIQTTLKGLFITLFDFLMSIWLGYNVAEEVSNKRLGWAILFGVGSFSFFQKFYESWTFTRSRSDDESQ